MIDVSIREKVLEEIKSKKPYKEISKEYGISIGTINLWVSKYLKSNNDKKEVSSKIKGNNTTADCKDKPSVVVSKKKVLYAGMIYDRHLMPKHVTKYIIKESFVEDIFNFSWMDSQVMNFVHENIKFTNIDDKLVPDTDLVLYVTGLSSLMASIIKICNEMGINLTLMHYCKNNPNKYCSQVISKDSNSVTNLSKIFNSHDDNTEIIFMNINSIDEIKYLNHIAVIRYKDYSDLGNSKIMVFKNESNAFVNLVKLQELMISGNHKVDLTLEIGMLNTRGIYVTNKILVSCSNK